MTQTEEQKRQSIRLSNRKYYEKNKERLNRNTAIRKRLGRDQPKSDVVSNKYEYRFLVSARARAKSKNIICDIDIEDILIPDVCPILGIPIYKSSGIRNDNSPSLDRLDNNKGYIKGNIIIISWRANRLKNDGTWQEHQAIAEFVRAGLSLP